MTTADRYGVVCPGCGGDGRRPFRPGLPCTDCDGWGAVANPEKGSSIMSEIQETALHRIIAAAQAIIARSKTPRKPDVLRMQWPCPNCGNDSKPHHRYCPKCGTERP